VELRDSPDERSFREGLRAWLTDNLPEGWNTPAWKEPEDQVGFLKDWTRKLHETGYSGLSWPKEYGGAGAPTSFQAIAYEELARAEAPDHVGVIGIGMAGPTIIAAGTDAHKKAYLAKILSGEEIWCQGFSEPGSGSDLASLQAKAVPDGDGYRITGQKVWSSFAHIADRCILLARTNPDAPKHAGITFFLLDMHADGVETRPLRQITGEAEFNEIFLDDVYVPRDQIVGEVDHGWQVGITTLMFERGTSTFFLIGYLDSRFRNLVQLAKETPRNGGVAADDPGIRDRIARAYADIEALRFTNYRSLSGLLKTGVPGPEGSIAKLHWSEAHQRLTHLALDILGPDASLAPGGAKSWQHRQLRTRGNTIEAGSSEILRNIVAERVLGLPKSR
jgi:alkylation response protein AidB-like acyl-CoA dehydrogenase